MEAHRSLPNANWIEECPAAITVCDADGTIVAMNEKAHLTFLKDGGRNLIGTSIFACHPETANVKIRKLLDSGESNCYTIEKNGVKKLIYQFPWREQGKLAGLVELSIEIPFVLPHFVRDSSS
jgi:transcriptional regulator with PAS, ATPase and Fis domain